MPMKSRTAEVTLRVSPPRRDATPLCPPGHGAPAVSATGTVLPLMEQAAAKLVRAMLAPGESSVPVGTNLGYASPELAPACAPGAQLRAVARHDRSNGRVHRFIVHVFDESGLIASGTHECVVVASRRVAAPARRRAVPPAMPLRA